MDAAAAEFGIEPVEIRRRNLIEKFPYTSATGLVFDEGSYRQTLEMAVSCASTCRRSARRQQQARSQRPVSRHRLRDVLRTHRLWHAGLRCARHGGDARAGRPSSWRWTRPASSKCGSAPARTAKGCARPSPRLVADELGRRARPDQGRARRYRPHPYGWGTFASRSLVIAGGASVLAARKVRAKLKNDRQPPARGRGGRHRARRRRRARRRHRPRDADRDAGARRLSPGSSASRARSTRRSARARPTIRPARSPTPVTPAIVEVDPETGRVTIERFVVAEDAGRLVNPMIVDGQIDRRRRAGHRQRAAGRDRLRRDRQYPHGDARRFSAADEPRDAADRAAAPGNLDGRDHHQAKGLGEGGAIGAPAAVLNAINDALAPFGVTIDEIPATPQRIRAALRQATKKARMSERSDITLTINGHAHAIRVEPRRTLVDAIREDCGQTGTHIGCEHGVCGACTVLVDGEPVRSCLMFAVQADGREIRTVEGLANGDELNPLQRAFMEHHGLQCGFCTPGFLMLVTGVLEREPDISDEDLRRRALVQSVPLHRLSEHRQGGARGRRARCALKPTQKPAVRSGSPMAPPDAKPKEKFVGRSVPRLEDRPLVTGRGRFAADISFPHQLHMRVVRSNFAHGRHPLDRRRARRWRMPGVHAVWTAADVADIPPIDFRLTRIEGLEPYRQRLFATGTRALRRRAGRGGVRRRSLSRRGRGRARRARHRGIAGAPSRRRGARRVRTRPLDRARDRPQGLRRHRRGIPLRSRRGRARRSRSGGIPACRSKPAAPLRATTRRATCSSFTAPPRCRIGTATRSPACSGAPSRRCTSTRAMSAAASASAASFIPRTCWCAPRRCACAGRSNGSRTAAST